MGVNDVYFGNGCSVEVCFCRGTYVRFVDSSSFRFSGGGTVVRVQVCLTVGLKVFRFIIDFRIYDRRGFVRGFENLCTCMQTRSPR